MFFGIVTRSNDGYGRFLQAGNSSLGGLVTSSLGSSSSTSQPAKRVRHNEDASTTSASGDDGDDNDDEDDEDESPWDMFQGWSTLGGPPSKEVFKWKDEQPDLVELFGMSFERNTNMYRLYHIYF